MSESELVRIGKCQNPSEPEMSESFKTGKFQNLKMLFFQTRKLSELSSFKIWPYVCMYIVSGILGIMTSMGKLKQTSQQQSHELGGLCDGYWRWVLTRVLQG